VSVHLQQLDISACFLAVWYWRALLKSVAIFRYILKSDSSNGHFTWSFLRAGDCMGNLLGAFFIVVTIIRSTIVIMIIMVNFVTKDTLVTRGFLATQTYFKVTCAIRKSRRQNFGERVGALKLCVLFLTCLHVNSQASVYQKARQNIWILFCIQEERIYIYICRPILITEGSRGHSK
jgi:hypothetical protein